jgi:uncharacterized protein YjdB
LYNRNNGSVNATHCAGVTGTTGAYPEAANMAGTPYDWNVCCSVLGKTGDFAAQWASSVAPVFVPAVKRGYQNGAATSIVFGPFSPYTVSGGHNDVNLCFYTTNAINGNTITFELVNPINDTPYATCNYLWSSSTSIENPLVAPAITFQPASQTRCTGSSVTFSVTAVASSGGTLSYQWRKNSTNIVGATNSTYTISGLVTGDAGNYHVLIKEFSRYTTSKTATLTVNTTPLLSSWSSPSCTSPCLGNSATVTVNSSSLGIGTYTVTYNLSGANSATGNTATLTMGLSSGTFTIPAAFLMAPGGTTVTITSIALGACSTSIATSNTASFAILTTTSITSSTGDIVCDAGSAHLSAVASVGTLNWYAASIGGASLGTGATFTTPVIGATTTYYVAATSGGCTTGSRVAVTATVTPTPTITGTTPGSRCNAGAVSLSATASAGTLNWYAASSGGSPLGTGLSFTTPVIASTTTYYVSASSGGCTTGTRTAVAATVINTPTITGSTPGSRCDAGIVSLSATGSAGTLNWYSAISGGLSMGTGSTFITPVIAATTTYYVDATTGSCTTGTRTAVTATVKPTPTITGTTPGSRCNTGSVSLSAIASAGVLSWYTASTGGSLICSCTPLITPSISATTTYYVSASSAGCTSPRTAVTATVNNSPSITSITPGSRCDAGTVSLSATGSAGTLNWYSASSGGSSLGTGTTFITPAIATTTTYYVDATSSGCTTGTRTAVIATVNPRPAAITGPGTITLGSTITLSNITGSGTWSSSNASRATVDSSTGVVNGVAVGGVTISYTVGTGCYATKLLNVSAITGTLSVCVGGTTSLGSVTPGGTWTSANASIATVGSLTGNVTGVSAGTVVISYTYSGIASTAVVTVNSLPVMASITGANGLCVGSTMTLSNTTTGGVWSSGSGIVTVGSATGLITGLGMGAAKITYTVTDVNSCTNLVTDIVDVNGEREYFYTYAGTGSGVSSGDGGPGYLAAIPGPRAMNNDTAGNLYIADISSTVGHQHLVRKISTNGYITVVAGNGIMGNSGDGGPATAASLNFGAGGGIYVDRAGNIYIACTNTHTLRKVDISSGIITTICGIPGTAGYNGDGGLASAAKLSYPLGICADTFGNIYVADQGNHRIRKINSMGVISTIIGTGSANFSGDGGPGTAATLKYPRDVVFDNLGNLYIADNVNNAVRKYNLSTGIIQTLAGTSVIGMTGDGGLATAATLNGPARLVFDGGRKLYLTDQVNSKVRVVDLSTGIISTAIGTGVGGFSGDYGPATAAQIKWPAGLAMDKNGHLFVCDIPNHRIRVAPYATSIAIAASSSAVPHGTPITLTAYPSIKTSNTSLQWQKNGVNIGTGAITLTDVPSSAGSYTYSCILTVVPDCDLPYTDTSNFITVVASAPPPPFVPSAVNALNPIDLKVFPNPVHGILNIESSEMAIGNVTIHVSNQLGSVLISKVASVSNNHLAEQLDMNLLPGGLYIISITDANSRTWIYKCMKN